MNKYIGLAILVFLSCILTSCVQNKEYEDRITHTFNLISGGSEELTVIWRRIDDVIVTAQTRGVWIEKDETVESFTKAVEAKLNKMTGNNEKVVSYMPDGHKYGRPQRVRGFGAALTLERPYTEMKVRKFMITIKSIDDELAKLNDPPRKYKESVEDLVALYAKLKRFYHSVVDERHVASYTEYGRLNFQEDLSMKEAIIAFQHNYPFVMHDIDK